MTRRASRPPLRVVAGGGTEGGSPLVRRGVYRARWTIGGRTLLVAVAASGEAVTTRALDPGTDVVAALAALEADLDRFDPRPHLVR